jgi:hypothetical protein
MKSIEERLIESDPSPEASYAVADYSAMISRVVATPLAKPASGLRAFKLRMAGSVAVASLLTVLGIAAIDTVGSSLPVLGFAAASTHQTAGGFSAAKSAITPTPTSAGTTSGLMIPAVNYQFSGASSFSSQSGTATVYALLAPSDAADSLTHAASVLSVDIGTPDSHDGGQTYISTGPKYSGTLAVNAGYAQWQISTSSYGAPATASGPSVSSLETRAFELAQQMGSLDLGVATLLPVPGPLGGPTFVTVPIVIGGEPTDLGYDFTFAGDGTLVSASGEDFTLEAGESYPTISPSAGVGEITSQIGLSSITPGWFGAVGSASGVSGSGSSGAVVPPTSNGTVATTTGPSNSSGTSPGSPPSSGTSPSTLTPTVVDLTGVSTKYGLFTMSDSTQMMLPTYLYTGMVVGASPYEVTFQVVAVNPSYLDLASVQDLHN